MLIRKRYRSVVSTVAPTPVPTRADLQIRDLLEYPPLRRALGLDRLPASVVQPWPAPIWTPDVSSQRAA